MEILSCRREKNLVAMTLFCYLMLRESVIRVIVLLIRDNKIVSSPFYGILSPFLYAQAGRRTICDKGS